MGRAGLYAEGAALNAIINVFEFGEVVGCFEYRRLGLVRRHFCSALGGVEGDIDG